MRFVVIGRRKLIGATVVLLDHVLRGLITVRPGANTRIGYITGIVVVTTTRVPKGTGRRCGRNSH